MIKWAGGLSTLAIDARRARASFDAWWPRAMLRRRVERRFRSWQSHNGYLIKLSCFGGLGIVSTLVGLGPRPSTLVGLGFVSTLSCACGDCVAESSVAGSRGVGRTLAYSKLSRGRSLGGCRTGGMGGIAAMSKQRHGIATMRQHQHGSSYQIVYKVSVFHY